MSGNSSTVKLLARARALRASNPKYTASAPPLTAARSCGQPPAGANISGFRDVFRFLKAGCTEVVTVSSSKMSGFLIQSAIAAVLLGILPACCAMWFGSRLLGWLPHLQMRALIGRHVSFPFGGHVESFHLKASGRFVAVQNAISPVLTSILMYKGPERAGSLSNSLPSLFFHY